MGLQFSSPLFLLPSPAWSDNVDAPDNVVNSSFEVVDFTRL